MGSAAVHAQVWGPGVNDWADIQEGQCAGMYPAILDALALPEGGSVLDVGCGTGLFSKAARERGLLVTGIDASEVFIERAKRRVEAATFVTGEMEELPFADEMFDAAVGCNAFQYAASPVHALTEARRVVKNGRSVAIAVWGSPERCEAASHIKALGTLLPPAPPGSPGPFALSNADALQSLLRDAGLHPEGVREVEVTWQYRDEEHTLRGMMSAGPAIRARAHAGDDATREALREAIAPYRQSDGTFRMKNVFIFALGRK
ncbi:MAG: class I SAM-dependent methyltransferase [Candidatus Baltobacteraceae bacterium]